jgi:predicted alpha/beta hydrolase
MQAASDIMLGWLHTNGLDGQERDFYIRQLWDAKGSAAVELLEPNAMAAYAELCGWTLAKAHARSGDAIAIGSYLGSGEVFDTSMATFAERYADQNERDYEALKQAVASGRVKAESGL